MEGAADLFRESRSKLPAGKRDALLGLTVAGEAECLLRLGQMGRAVEVCRDVLQGPDGMPDGVRASLQTMLGRGLFALGEYEQAREAFLASRDASSGSPAHEMVNLVHLANIDLSLGRFERAGRAYGKAVRLAHDTDSPLAEADGRMGEALIAHAAGFWDEAESDYREALRLCEDAGDSRRLAILHNNLGLILEKRGDTKGAEAAFEEAIRLSEQVGDRPARTRAACNLGYLRGRTGRADEARGSLVAALADATRSGDRRGETLANLRLGWLLVHEREMEAALESLGRAVDLARETGDVDAEWRALYGAGAAQEGAGRGKEALRVYVEAAEVLERRYAELGPPTLDLLFRTGAEDLYARIIRLLLEEHREDEAFGYLERNRLRERSERMGGFVPRGGKPASEVGEALRELRHRQAAYHEARHGQRLMMTPLVPEDEAEIDRRIRVCRSERERLLARLAGPERGLHDPFSSSALDVRSLCAHIPADTVLVEYFMADPDLLLFTLQREGLRVFRAPVARSALESASRELRDLVLRCDADSGAFGRLKDLSAELYEHLIAPAREAVDGKLTLGLVPHGALHNVPFSMLVRRDETGGERYLVEDHRIFCLNVRHYADFLTRPEGGLRIPRHLLGFANPDGSLPGARDELLEAKEVFRDARLFFGKEATERRAKRLADSADILAFAVHGVFDGRGPLGSYLELASDGREDGRLTVAEVCRLALCGSPLVVLSACESGVGNFVAGVGKASLADAFVAAGARSVVNTLWEVDDRATQAFMAAFYHALGYQDIPDALRTVQMAFISGRLGKGAKGPRVVRGAGRAIYPSIQPPQDVAVDYTHPYYWGGFVAIGRWR